jgi:hypothetical protein
LLFFRHSGPALYPLGKSVGYETSGISCPTTHKHNHEVRWGIEAVRLEKHEWCFSGNSQKKHPPTSVFFF